MSEFQWHQDDYQPYSVPPKPKKSNAWLKTLAIAVASSVLTSAVLCSGFFLYFKGHQSKNYSSTLPQVTGTTTVPEGNVINQIATAVGPAVVGIGADTVLVEIIALAVDLIILGIGDHLARADEVIPVAAGIESTAY